MEYIKLNNGVSMPMIGFGTCELRGNDGVQLIKEAIQMGYRLIDTAHMYGNEKEVGEAIRESGVAREELFITTKMNRPFDSYEKAKEGIELSLKNMQLDYIDLYLIHEPYENDLPMYQALMEYYEKKKLRAIGISNYSKRKYDAFIKECGVIPAVNQIESHVYYPQRELVKHMKKSGTIAQAWAPLAGGNKDIGHEMVLCEIDQKYHKSPYQVALRYLIQNGISIIPKSHSLERIQSNYQLFDFSLSQEELDKIEQLNQKVTLYDWMKHWE